MRHPAIHQIAGLSSNESLQRVKRLYQARKAGHTGSLDRLATGLLPICFGEATKLSGFLLNADKCYRAIMKLGVVTTTGDAEGEVVSERPVVDVDAARVAAVFRAMLGEQTQVPPMHSALKHRGQRLYELAHRGIAIERQPRPIVIHALDLVHFLGDGSRSPCAVPRGPISAPWPRTSERPSVAGRMSRP